MYPCVTGFRGTIVLALWTQSHHRQIVMGPRKHSPLSVGLVTCPENHPFCLGPCHLPLCQSFIQGEARCFLYSSCWFFSCSGWTDEYFNSTTSLMLSRTSWTCQNWAPVHLICHLEFDQIQVLLVFFYFRSIFFFLYLPHSTPCPSGFNIYVFTLLVTINCGSWTYFYILSF